MLEKEQIIKELSIVELKRIEDEMWLYLKKYNIPIGDKLWDIWQVLYSRTFDLKTIFEN